MQGGFITISRTLPNHWLWQDADLLKWWLDLLIMASWEDKQVLHDSHLITLQRGQMIASISFLVNRWGKSKPTIINFLKQLEDEGMITRKVMYRQTSVLTICNYERYQLKGDTIADTIRDRQINENLRCNSDRQKETINISESMNLWYHKNSDADTIADTIADENKENKELINNNINARAREEDDLKIENLKSQQIWLEAMAMRYNFSNTQEVIKWLDIFALDVQCRENKHNNMGDMKRHFCDWLRIQLDKQNQKNQNRNGNQRNKYDQRRGSEVTATSAKDFEDSF